MNCLRLSAITAVVCATATIVSASSQCKVGELISKGGHFHGENECGNLAEYNKYKDSMGRHENYMEYKRLGSYASVPNEKTVMCPSNEQGEISLQDPSHTIGMDAVWIVENTSDEPVVVAYVNHKGKEVSSKHPSIYPAQDDPDAILQPNSWMPVYTFEGHVFHVRTVTQDGTPGDLLMQHRVGLKPIGQHLASQLVCGRDDPEPVVEVISETEEKEIVRDEAFAREQPQILRPCNTLDIGFRNMAGCPLHGYYILAEEQAKDELDENDPRIQDGLSSCTEIFRFHLGVEQTHLNDFMWQWQSSTKFEGTFIGHSFAFRLASDPSVLVDRVTLQPTHVPSCPNLKSKAGNGLGNAKVGQNVNVGNRNNNPDETMTLALTKTTTTRASKRLRRRRELEKIRIARSSSIVEPSFFLNDTSSSLSTNEKLRSFVPGGDNASGNITVSVGVPTVPATGGVYSY